MQKLFLIFLVGILLQCESAPVIPTKRQNAGLNGHPIFVELELLPAKTTKHLNLKIKVENISDQSIRDFSILLFAKDKQTMILVPETYKTPELICHLPKLLRSGHAGVCPVLSFQYASDFDRIHINSISLTMEDGTRHFITSEELEAIHEWK